MAHAAPRISHRLVRALERLDDGVTGAGELTRLAGAEAERLGVLRPSYEQVRVLVGRLREQRARPSNAEVLLDVATRRRAPEALLDHVAGTLPPK